MNISWRERLAGWIAPSLLASHAPDDDFWYRDVGAMTAAGVRIDATGAQKVSAWYRGRDLLATSLAMLPLHLWKRLPEDRGRERAHAHTLYRVLHRKPNPYQDSFEWRRLKMYHLIDYGNAYDFLRANGTSYADQLWPIHPTLVTPELSGGRMRYRVRDPKTGQTETYYDDAIFHLRGASDDGVVGKGILEQARDSVALGLTVESYASKLFGKGGLHAGVIETPGLLTTEAAQRMAASFKTAWGDWHMPKVLEQGATFKPAQFDPEKLQMLLSRRFTVNDIARWLGVPPHMIGDLERATFTNIEHQGQEFVTYSLGPWLSLFEFAINDQLVLQPDTYYAEFTRDALVRGDIKTRWEAHVAAVGAGIKAVNEVRETENLNKIDGFDRPEKPANVVGSSASRRERSESEASVETTSTIVLAAASRLLRKEIKAIQRLAVKHAADGDAFAVAVTAFYAAHVDLVVATLALPADQAQQYCAGQAAQIVTGEWMAALARWETPAYASGLAALAVDDDGLAA